MRKGYFSEYKCKKENEDIYGVGNVIKVAIGGAQDFIIAKKGKIIKIIEVKEIHNKNYSPRPREKKQIENIIKFAKNHNIQAELWIYKYFGTGKPVIKNVKILAQKDGSKS